MKATSDICVGYLFIHLFSCLSPGKRTACHIARNVCYTSVNCGFREQHSIDIVPQ